MSEPEGASAVIADLIQLLNSLTWPGAFALAALVAGCVAVMWGSPW